ncbi:MAG: helicase-exonuclease AddAB subunit AddA [Negativicoccus succinicivorans]|uniref:helicase-exonuclease AddAB subunit AddA n=1 Tax=Negativicoccus succinicivorans TaxID=620903 RepID=UPI00290C0251|nr:helicase-exonuclease AddAB subunit AddA [Negativicoccus succinicivorans]MDU5942596.1 helicase-exonuclease AddAB subunit AddA [Negativicoccus succinicivorans]
MQWTTEQEAAITSRRQNLLVAAAAGSGKTAVLVERIIRRLLDPHDPADITRILVMTFTRAAAQEMRTRIGTALAAAAATTPSAHIDRQLALLGSAQISTIHAFCQQIIRQYFYRLDLDAGFRQGGEQELALGRLEALEQTLFEAYEEASPEFLQLADFFRTKTNDAQLRAAVLRLYEYSRSMPFPEAWLEALAAPYAEADLADLTPLWEEWRAGVTQWRTQLQNASDELALYPQLQNAREVLAADYATATALCDGADWDAIYDAAQAYAPMRWPGGKLKDEAAKAAKTAAKEIRDAGKAWLKGWTEGILAAAPATWREDLQVTAPLVAALVKVTKTFATAYTTWKKSERLIDFSDLEHYALTLLLAPESTPDAPLPSDIARELAREYDEIMVDEYQDTNGVQELIASLIARADNRFMVGDVKQSIYRFRLADPTIFLGQYERFSRDAQAPSRRIDLRENFRSDRTVLDAVNEVFARIMQPPAAEFSYDENAAFIPGRTITDAPENWVGGSVSVRFVTPSDDATTMDAADIPPADDDAEEEPLSAMEAQAQAIADELLHLHETAVVQENDGAFRPFRWRDAVILMRSVASRIDVFVEVLRSAGIPVYAEQAGGYFAATEVQTMLSLLRWLDNSRRDLEAAAVLRSPLVGCDERDLAEMALLRDEEAPALWDVLPAWLTRLTDEEKRGRVGAFYALLSGWQLLARQAGIGQLVRRIYEESGYHAYVGGLPSGSLRRANLEALYARAVEFDDGAGGGISRFLEYLEELQRQKQDLSVPSTMGENEDAVRIMTIHKSKGLEFPVVFLANIDKEFNRKDTQARLLLHRRYGIGLSRYDAKRRLTYPTVRWHLLREILRRETLAEEQRLLYVAMTRARDKLYLYAGPSPTGAHVAPEAARSYLDWLWPHLETGTLPRWDVQTVTPIGNEAVATVADPRLENVRQGTLTGTPLPTEISERLSWQYDKPLATQIPAKVTVTEVTHHLGEITAALPPLPKTERPAADYPLPILTVQPVQTADEMAATKAVRLVATEEDAAAESEIINDAWVRPPQFVTPDMRPDGGARYGTLMHRILAEIGAGDGTTTAQAYLDQLQQAQKITPAEAKLAHRRDLDLWLTCDTAAEIRQSSFVLRECPFGMLLPASVALGVPTGDDEVFLQGVIDCLYATASGDLAILDYKTDRVDTANVLYERYHRQLDLYAHAATRIWQRPVVKKIIYSLALHEAITWQDDGGAVL